MKRGLFRLLPETATRKLRSFWNLIYSLFHTGTHEYEPSDFSDDAPPDDGAFLCIEEEQSGRGPDWETRNVMVGSLRTAEQLHDSLERRRYYTPDRFLPSGTDQTRYIALHEEGIGTEPCIRYWGEVSAVQYTARNHIEVPMRPGSDPQELYRLYTVEEWYTLPRPIRLLDTYRGRPRFTTKFLLEHCTRSYQLFTLTAEDDLALMRLLDRIFEAGRNDPSAWETAEYSFGEISLRIRAGMLTATDSEGYLPDTVPMDWLARHPRAGFCRIKKMLRRDSEQISGFGENSEPAHE